MRDRQLLEGARTCLAKTARRGSTVEEREAAVVWLQEAAVTNVNSSSPHAVRSRP